MSFDAQTIAQILTTVVSVGLAAIGGVWKLSELKSTIMELIGKLATEVALLHASLGERAKEIGKLETNQSTLKNDFNEVNKKVILIEANQLAMWDTLNSLFPEKVPKRAKDKNA